LSRLGDRLLTVHDAFDRARLPHAFGGAIALAYCTSEPRGTRDVDVNVFVAPDRADAVAAALPDDVVVGANDLELLHRDGQARLWWDDTPIDVFLDVHDFHRQVSKEIRDVPFEGRSIPVLSCDALAVFKAFFNRTRDWADIEAMLEADALDGDRVLGTVVRLLGIDDPATTRLRSLL
jgi:hypothetical protein